MDSENNSDSKSEVSNNQDSGAVGTSQDQSNEPGKKQGGSSGVKCEICSCEMSSAIVMNSHINGSRHKKRMKALEIVANLKALGEKGIDLGSETTSSHCYKCDLCCLTVNSPQQLEIHLSGAKHKSKVAKERTNPGIGIVRSIHVSALSLNNDDTPPVKRKKKEDHSMACDVCNIVVNSETQYEQHIYSRKHLSRLRIDTANRITIPESEPNFPQPFLPAKRSYEKNNSDEASPPDDDSDNQHRGSNGSSAIQVLPQDNQLNQNHNQSLNQNRNENGNGGHFGNYRPSPRHFMNNRQYGVQFGGVGLYEVGRFFSKPRCNNFNSKN